MTSGNGHRHCFGHSGAVGLGVFLVLENAEGTTEILFEVAQESGWPQGKVIPSSRKAVLHAHQRGEELMAMLHAKVGARGDFRLHCTPCSFPISLSTWICRGGGDAMTGVTVTGCHWER